MTTPPRVVIDRDELVAFFDDDRPAHLYALADLDDLFWVHSRWWRRGDAVVGLVGLPEDGGNAVYAVSTRAPAATLDLLAELSPEIPTGTLVTGPIGCGNALAAVRDVEWHRRYHRFFHPAPFTLTPRRWEPEPLDRSHVAELDELHALDPGAAFYLPAMLDTGVFVGVREHGRLIAVAGAHVVSDRQRVAAIGGVLTHPEHRRRGLGFDVTAGVCARLEGRVDNVGLNSADRNTAARALYTGMGFREHIAYEECGLA